MPLSDFAGAIQSAVSKATAAYKPINLNTQNTKQNNIDTSTIGATYNRTAQSPKFADSFLNYSKKNLADGTDLSTMDDDQLKNWADNKQYDFQINGTKDEWYNAVNSPELSNYYVPYFNEFGDLNNRANFEKFWDRYKPQNAQEAWTQNGSKWTDFAGTDATAWTNDNRGYLRDNADGSWDGATQDTDIDQDTLGQLDATTLASYMATEGTKNKDTVRRAVNTEELNYLLRTPETVVQQSPSDSTQTQEVLGYEYDSPYAGHNFAQSGLQSLDSSKNPFSVEDFANGNTDTIVQEFYPELGKRNFFDDQGYQIENPYGGNRDIEGKTNTIPDNLRTVDTAQQKAINTRAYPGKDTYAQVGTSYAPYQSTYSAEEINNAITNPDSFISHGPMPDWDTLPYEIRGVNDDGEAIPTSQRPKDSQGLIIPSLYEYGITEDQYNNLQNKFGRLNVPKANTLESTPQKSAAVSNNIPAQPYPDMTDHAQPDYNSNAGPYPNPISKFFAGGK